MPINSLMKKERKVLRTKGHGNFRHSILILIKFYCTDRVTNFSSIPSSEPNRSYSRYKCCGSGSVLPVLDPYSGAVWIRISTVPVFRIQILIQALQNLANLFANQS